MFKPLIHFELIFCVWCEIVWTAFLLALFSSYSVYCHGLAIPKDVRLPEILLLKNFTIVFLSCLLTIMTSSAHWAERSVMAWHDMSCQALGAGVLGALHFTEVTLVTSGTTWWALANWKCLVMQWHFCVIFMGTIMQGVRRHWHLAGPSWTWGWGHVTAILVPSWKCAHLLPFLIFQWLPITLNAISLDSQYDI